MKRPFDFEMTGAKAAPRAVEGHEDGAPRLAPSRAIYYSDPDPAD